MLGLNYPQKFLSIVPILAGISVFELGLKLSVYISLTPVPGLSWWGYGLIENVH